MPIAGRVFEIGNCAADGRLASIVVGSGETVVVSIREYIGD
jgi:hypothetical protein